MLCLHILAIATTVVASETPAAGAGGGPTDATLQIWTCESKRQGESGCGCTGTAASTDYVPFVSGLITTVSEGVQASLSCTTSACSYFLCATGSDCNPTEATTEAYYKKLMIRDIGPGLGTVNWPASFQKGKCYAYESVRVAGVLTPVAMMKITPPTTIVTEYMGVVLTHEGLAGWIIALIVIAAVCCGCVLPATLICVCCFNDKQQAVDQYASAN